MSINNVQVISALLLYIISIFANNFQIESNFLIIETGRPRVLIYITAIIILFFSFLLTIKTFKIILPSKLISFVLLIGIFSSILNSIVIEDIRPMLNYCILNILIFAFINFFAYTNFPIINIKKIVYGILFINIAFILLCVILEPFTLYRYRGIFDSSNSSGRVIGYISAIFFAYMIFFKKTPQQNILALVFIFLSITLLLATNSRTPILICILSVMLLLFVYNWSNNKNLFRFLLTGGFFKYIFILLPVLLLPFLIVFYTLNFYVYSGSEYIPNLYENFKYQFERDPGSYGTSGRIIRWQNAINDYFSFFGSKEYADLSFSKIEVHNNYISQSLKFGIIPSITFHLLPIIIFFHSLKRIVKEKVKEASISLVLSFFLIIYYIFETSTLITPFWMLIVLEAIFLSNERKNKKIND